MIKLPSYQRHRTDYYSGDPAFEQPPTDLPDSASDDERKAHAETVKAYLHKIEVARDTGDWSALRVAGVEPTEFTFKQFPGDVLRVVGDLWQEGKLGVARLAQISFRACVVSVTNLGDIKVTRERDRQFGELASVDFANKLDAIDPRIIGELGQVCFDRAFKVSPKS